MGNNVANIGTIARRQQHGQRGVPDQRAAHVAQGPPQLKFGGSWNHYVMERYYSGNNGQLGFIQYNGAFTGVRVRRLPARSGAEKGRGSLTDAVDAAAEPRRVLRRRRLQGHRQPDAEPRPALGLHVAARREGRSAGELRPDQRRAAARRPERQQPRALRAVLQRLGAAPRRRLPRWATAGSSAAATASRSTWKARARTCACR